MGKSNNNEPPPEHDAVTEALIEAIQSGGVMLSLNQIFESFHPKEGEVQDFWLRGVADRARDIVSNRSAEEIREAVMLAEWMVQQRLSFRVTPEAFAKMVGAPNESLAHILLRRMAFFDINGVEDPRDVTWPEIFASISLVYVALGESGKKTEQAMAAVEAICIAETLHDQAQAVTIGVEEKISARARKGGMARAKRFDELRCRVEALWERGDYKTFVDAADAFFEIEEDIIKTLPGARSKRSVIDWISKYEKLPGSRKKPPRSRR